MASIRNAINYLEDAASKLNALESKIVNVVLIDDNASTMDAMKQKIIETKESLRELENLLDEHEYVISEARSHLGL